MRETISAGNLKNNLRKKIKYIELKYILLTSTSFKNSTISIIGFCAFIFSILFFLSSCASLETYEIYSNNMFIGRKFLRQNKYALAKPYFLEASKQIKDSTSLSYLATTCYKTGDIDNAETLIEEAEKIDNNTYAYLRLTGYRALVSLKKDRLKGRDALMNYIRLYEYLFPLTTIQNVEDIYDDISNGKEVDMVALEKLLDEQILWYEDDIEQFLSTKTGFYDKNSSTGF